MKKKIKSRSDLGSLGSFTVKIRSIILVSLETHPAQGSGAVAPCPSVAQDTGQPELLTVHISPHNVMTWWSSDVTLQLGANPVRLSVTRCQPSLLHRPPGDGAGHGHRGQDGPVAITGSCSGRQPVRLKVNLDLILNSVPGTPPVAHGHVELQ